MNTEYRTVLVTDTRAFEREVARLNKRAHKVGLDPIVCKQMGRKTVYQERTVVVMSEGEASARTRAVPVDVMEYDMMLPSLEEYRWTLAATVTPVDGGEAFVDLHVKGLDRAPYVADPCRCQHCNSRRHRSLTYVVQNKDDGRTLQVGRNCFEDYVGRDGLLRLEFMAAVTTIFSGDGDDDCFFPSGRAQVNAVEVVRAIAVAEAIAEQHGGWRNNQRDDFGDITVDGTHRLAAKHLRGDSSCGIFNRVIEMMADPEDPLWAKAREIVAELQELDAGDDEFAQTLAYCAQFEVVPEKKASLVAYSGQFLRNRKERAEREAKKATMRYVGEVGKRQVFAGLECRKLASYESQYGTTYIHIFHDSDGNEIVWKTGQVVASEGEKVSLKATVKAHEEYKGAKQTVITRAKLQP